MSAPLKEAEEVMLRENLDRIALLLGKREGQWSDAELAELQRRDLTVWVDPSGKICRRRPSARKYRICWEDTGVYVRRPYFTFFESDNKRDASMFQLEAALNENFFYVLLAQRLCEEIPPHIDLKKIRGTVEELLHRGNPAIRKTVKKTCQEFHGEASEALLEEISHAEV